MARNAASSSGGVIATLPGSFPTAIVPENVDVDAVAASFIPRFESLSAADFTSDAIWRDLYSLTGTTRTVFSSQAIGSTWKAVCSTHRPADFALVPGTAQAVRVAPNCSWIEAQFIFKTRGSPALSCAGFVSLVPDAQRGWKIWLLRTLLEGLENVPDVDTLQPKELSEQPQDNRDPKETETNKFDCVVVGGGHGGLCVAGRLQALGLSYVVVEKHPRVGESWMTRYDTVKLHTVRNWANLPFEKSFTPEYPDLLTKYNIEKVHKLWANKYGINIWFSTSLESGKWNRTQGSWTLSLSREGKDIQVDARHLVLAVGVGGDVPVSPSLPGKENFKGDVLHTGNYKSGSPWEGKSGVVIGTGCSAHDVSEDMLDNKLSKVTMVQRGSTYVIPSENYHKLSLALYNDTMPLEKADRINLTGPLALGRQRMMRELDGMARAQSERFDALERAGFKADRYGDILYHLNERLGGFYLDVGASEKISQGLIKMKSDANLTGFDENGLVFDDGSTLPADVVVFATGFVGTIRPTITKILGQDIANQVKEGWGLDEEGELVGAFKDTGHPGLWYAGGPLGHSRFLSRFMALKIKADVMGTPLPIFERQSAVGKLPRL